MSWLGSAPRDFLSVLRDSIRIWWVAPLIPLLAVLPEAAQHVAEIELGFFDTIERARAAEGSATRMGFGAVKIAGLVLAILAAVRFWGARGRGQRWWSPAGIAWRPLALGLGGLAAATLPGVLLRPSIGREAAELVDTILTLVTLPAFVLLAAGLAGDGAMTLRRAFTWGWLAALRILVFLVASWAPLVWLHTQNHRWALGAAEPAVWALMGFGSLVVGLMAVLAGTAIHHGYASPSQDAAAAADQK